VLLHHTAAGIAYSFDEPNLISSAGLAPVVRLAQSAELQNLANQLVTVAKTGGDKGAHPRAKSYLWLPGSLPVLTVLMI